MLIRIGAAFITVLALALPAPTWADFEQDKRRCLNSNPDTKIGGCTRLIQSGRFEKNDLAVAFNNRGVAYDQKGQYDRAIRDYTEAVRLRPDYFLAFKNRGRSKFHLARFGDAIPDLKEAVRRSPKDHYSAIWLYLAEVRAGRNGQPDLERAAPNLDLNNWPGPVVSLFLGRVDPKLVLTQANDRDAKKQREQRTEAYFYVGQFHLIRGSHNKAKALFRSMLELGVKTFSEYIAAQAELARMDK